MKKPELVYPETFIAEREVDGKKEYAFAIKRKFLIWAWLSIEYIDGLSSLYDVLYFDSDQVVKEAIDKRRKEAEDDYQKKLKTWHRKQAGEWKYKPYP